MRLVLFTGTGLRHKYIASQLTQNFDLALVISEDISEAGFSPFPEEDAGFISEHFQKRAQREQEFFGTYQEFPKEVPLRELPQGEINSEEISERVENIGPDLIVLYDCSIMESSLMDSYRSRIIALHLGLPPYYTGFATDLFPYYYEEPECIGATLQLVSVKGEEGEILHQLRPEMESGDDLHCIGNKLIHKAGKQLPGVLRGFARQHITPQPQLPSGKICLSTELTPELLREIYRKFDEGMIPEYLRHKSQRDASQPIVDADLQLE